MQIAGAGLRVRQVRQQGVGVPGDLRDEWPRGARAEHQVLLGQNWCFFPITQRVEIAKRIQEFPILRCSFAKQTGFQKEVKIKERELKDEIIDYAEKLQSKKVTVKKRKKYADRAQVDRDVVVLSALAALNEPNRVFRKEKKIEKKKSRQSRSAPGSTASCFLGSRSRSCPGCTCD